MFQTGENRRQVAYRLLDKLDLDVVNGNYSECEYADAFPIFGIKRKLYRKYIRQWATDRGVELKTAV